MISRFLVVDDYEPWRRHVCGELGKKPEWQVVGEAADGADALSKIADLRPDLVLLDIGMPRLNGIQTMRRLRTLQVPPKVLFLSEHRSWDIASAALEAGGNGYLLKSDSGQELVAAIVAVLDGRPFVSASVIAHAPADVAPHLTRARRRHHEGRFYSDDASLFEDFVAFARTSLAGGSPVIVLGIESRLPKLRTALADAGVDVPSAVARYAYHEHAVEPLLSRLMLGEMPDEARFGEIAASLLQAAQRGLTHASTPIVVWGECAPTLWRQGRGDAALRLEQLWSEHVTPHNVVTFCAYAVAPTPFDVNDAIIQQLCSLHTEWAER